MTATNVGVGIGTNAPTMALDIRASGDAFRVANGPTNGALFKVDLAWNEYANLVMNGYFGLFKKGTTSGADNEIVSFAPEYRIAGHYIMCNDVGIRTKTPQYALDVSGSLRVALGGTGLSDYASMIVGTTTSGVYISGARGNGLGYIRSPGGGLFIGGGTTSDTTMYILNNRVAINQTDTTYALGVTAGATTSAALNLSTWPRFATSLCHSVRGLSGSTGGGSTASYSMLFSNGSPTLNSALGTVTNDTVNGTYFTCLKSGIWSITLKTHTGSERATVAIDVGTTTTYNDEPNGEAVMNRALAYNFCGYFTASLAFTGYLAASTTTYYKFRTNFMPPAGSRPGTFMTIAFLGEQP